MELCAERREKRSDRTSSGGLHNGADGVWPLLRTFTDPPLTTASVSRRLYYQAPPYNCQTVLQPELTKNQLKKKYTFTNHVLHFVVCASIFISACSETNIDYISDTGSDYLIVWAGDKDGKDSDFLAVIDVRRSASTYGEIISTLPVGAKGTMPHHTEYEYPPNDILFANGWVAGQTFLIDLSDPLNPRLTGEFTSSDGYSYPHSFARLPDGNVLATFQSEGDFYAPPGGLVKLDAKGSAIQSASSRTSDIPDSLNWPYSLAVLPDIDRVITTSADMGMPPWHEWNYSYTYHVQIWSLSNLELLASIPLPEVEQGPYHIAPAEPRVLPDGSVYVSTFSCGLYHIEGIDIDTPKAAFVHAFPGSLDMGSECAVPVVVDNYWIQPVAALPGIVVLDISNPTNPVEVSRLTLGMRYMMPHWIAADRASNRIVITGHEMSWVLIAELDPDTGELTIDSDFQEKDAFYPGIDFNRTMWPHGETGSAVVHGALFRNK